MSISSELLCIKGRKQYFGPKDVVAFARANPDSEIYAAFERKGLWDDATAAEIGRLEFGRHLIHQYRVVIHSTGGEKVAVRGMISLTSDRQQASSFQFRADVLSNEERRLQMLQDSATELRSFARRYCDVISSNTLQLIETAIEQIESTAVRTSKPKRAKGGAAKKKRVAAAAAK